MKLRLLLLFTLLFNIAHNLTAQSLFSLKYRFTTIQDTTLYNVFLVRFDDGNGFYRVKFFDPYSGADILVDLDMEQKFYTDKNGVTDETKIYFKGSNPRIVQGDASYHYYPERFWFRLDKKTNLFEPWAITSPDEKNTAQGKFVQVPELLEQEDLTESFVSNFFSADEEFYQSLFETTQRSLTPEQKKVQMHLVIVANTDDATIGSTCVVDKDRTLKTFKDLAEFLGIGFDPKLIYGNDYNKTNVQNALSALRPDSKDIVVFYYTGHGFSDARQARDYPNMALSNKDYEDAVASSMNIQDVFNIIKNKGARMNLVISDCCNNSPEDRATLSCDAPQTRNSTIGWSLENCKALFMNDQPIAILASAAQKGEKSSGTLALGGFFTSQFRSTLTSYFGPFHQFPTWKVILDESQKSTIELADDYRCNPKAETTRKVYKQHPLFVIQ